MAMYSSVVNINNSIIWSNNGPIIYSPETSGVTYLEASYSDIEGGQDLFSQFSNIIFTTEGGIINQDPGFCFRMIQPTPCRRPQFVRKLQIPLELLEHTNQPVNNLV